MYALAIVLILLIIAIWAYSQEGFRDGRFGGFGYGGFRHRHGFHSAWVPGVYTGYIPLYELDPLVPRGINRCIDGDPMRPCWIADGSNGIEILR